MNRSEIDTSDCSDYSEMERILTGEFFDADCPDFEKMCKRRERDIIFDTVHEDNPSLTIKVSDGLTMWDGSISEVNQLTIPFVFDPIPDVDPEDIGPEELEGKGFNIIFHDGTSSGYVYVYDSTDLDKLLVKFYVEKESYDTQTKLKLLEVADGYKCVLYLPSMGGEYYVFVLGKKDSDTSPSRLQKVLPQGDILFYRSVDAMPSEYFHPTSIVNDG